MENKYMTLKNEISEFIKDGVCVAFSGGVDSSLILKIACEAARNQNKKVYAVTFDTRLHPISDVDISIKVASEMGAIHHIIQLDELYDAEIFRNPIDRCYRCKKALFTNLLKFAKDKGLKYVLDGTNADDLNEYRPGVQALKELNIISPLAQLSINKEEIRKIAKELSISVASRPSAPCMATRLPYGATIEYELLDKIHKGEEFIKSLGIDIIRLRVHGDIVRVEIEDNEFHKLLKEKNKVIKYLKELGFIYITLDLEGFRSGSMDIHLNNN